MVRKYFIPFSIIFILFVLIIIIFLTIRSDTANIINLTVPQTIAFMENNNQDDVSRDNGRTQSIMEEELDAPLKFYITNKRMDHSIINDDGELLALVYYDKPVIVGDLDTAEKINLIFEDQYYEWSKGDESDYWSVKWFLSEVKLLREHYTDDFLAIEPLRKTINYEIVLLTSEIISIKFISKSYLTGSKTFMLSGITVDLQTGERMPFDNIVSVDAYQFGNEISTFLIDRLKPSEDAQDMSFFIDHVKWIVDRYYRPNENGTFERNLDYDMEQINYLYYYDGSYFYIIDNNSINWHQIPALIKWNGKLGDDFEATLEPTEWGLWEVNS